MENCQVAVFAAYASKRGRALVDAELYLPKEWVAAPGAPRGPGSRPGGADMWPPRGSRPRGCRLPTPPATRSTAGPPDLRTAI